MKIAYLIPAFPMPSETFVYQEILNLIALGYDIKIFSFRPPSSDEYKTLPYKAQTLKIGTLYGSKQAVFLACLVSIPLVVRLWKQFAQFNFKEIKLREKVILVLRAAYMLKQIKKHKIEHIHAHWPHSTKIAHMVHAMHGTSFSVSIHAHEVAHENGHFESIFKAVTFASFCNRAAMDHLLTKLPNEARSKCHLNYHGVDTRRIKPRTETLPTTPLRIITIGRFNKTKGFHRLIRACATAIKSNVDLRLTILGNGDERSYLESLIAENKLNDIVTMPGWVTPNEVLSHLEKHHVFSLLSDTNYQDGLPNVLLEAMAVGLPAILSPLPAATEAIKNGEVGFILSSVDDYDGFVHACKQLSESTDLLTSMGTQASELIQQEYNARTHIQGLCRLFDQLRS